MQSESPTQTDRAAELQTVALDALRVKDVGDLVIFDPDGRTTEWLQCSVFVDRGDWR